MFENDSYEQTIINAAWYNKQMPKKRQQANWSRLTRKGIANTFADQDLKEGYLVTLESIKSQILTIEQLYSQTMGNLEREWTKQDEREKF